MEFGKCAKRLGVRRLDAAALQGAFGASIFSYPLSVAEKPIPRSSLPRTTGNGQVKTDH